MKGSMWRWKWETRRVWECPVCNRREKTGGHVVSRLCPCGEKAEPSQRTWMRLIEESKRLPVTGKLTSQDRVDDTPGSGRGDQATHAPRSPLGAD